LWGLEELSFEDIGYRDEPNDPDGCVQTTIIRRKIND
jgi:hypothetical protein